MEKLQSLSEEYQQLQKDLQAAVQSNQKLESQKQENLFVSKEFEKLGEENTIFKIVGPVLLKQEKVEAESTVKSRLAFIDGEITRVDEQIKSIQAKMDAKRTEIVQLQASLQAPPKPAEGTAPEAAAA